MLRIALSMLVNDTRKYVGIVLGLAFTSFMMALQPAVFIGLLDGVTSQIDQTPSVDIWVMAEDVKSVEGPKPMQSQVLFRIKGIEGVSAASPYFKGSTRIRNPNGELINATLIGIDDTTLLGAPRALQSGSMDDFHRNGTVFVDWASAKANGKLALQLQGAGQAMQIGDLLPIENTRAEIVGFHLGASGADPMPTLYVNFASLRRFVSDDRILSFVLVQVRPGADVTKIKSDIKRFTGLDALTGAEFKNRSYNYVLWETGTYVSFGTVTFIAFAIGASIAAQSFASFSRDNLRYFGLLNALGASKYQLRTMIFSQALIAAILGFGIGIGAMTALGTWLKGLDVGFTFSLPPLLITFSASSVLLVCLVSAFLSIRRVLKLEPSVVFKS
jgi:putative ABC transport system permease protein